MTVIEFRMFFDSLPEQEGLTQPSKKKFAKECDILVSILKQIAQGQLPFSELRVEKMLPVMRKYGFEG